uniref:Uncharacterized protein n=1 Tax=Calcidiscus leptoporus TaxID=127549 RepID=A0A7S0P0R2_9EUKA
MISPSIEDGDEVGGYLFTALPSTSTRNFAKFHLMSRPRSSPCSSFKYLKSGCVLGPFTSIFPKMGKVMPYLLTNSRISAAVPGSCAPNWLHGKASTSNPRGECCS